MRFEWDETKNRRNRTKHKVSFETARLVFDDPFVLVREDRVIEGEERWQAMGLVAGVVVLLVAYTTREVGGEEVIRIISARKAARQERQAYEEAHDRPN